MVVRLINVSVMFTRGAIRCACEIDAPTLATWHRTPLTSRWFEIVTIGLVALKPLFGTSSGYHECC